MFTVDQILNDEKLLKSVMSHVHDGIDYLDDKHGQLLEQNPEYIICQMRL